MQVEGVDLTQEFSRLCIYCSSAAHTGMKQGEGWSESPCRDAASFPTFMRGTTERGGVDLEG